MLNRKSEVYSQLREGSMLCQKEPHKKHQVWLGDRGRGGIIGKNLYCDFQRKEVWRQGKRCGIG